MAGIKPSVVEYFSKVLPERKNILCTDNDEPSKIFIDGIKEQYKKRINFDVHIPKNQKDWNNQLQANAK